MNTPAETNTLKPVATRDDSREFARRTLKNLLYIERSQPFGDVHVVTQLTNSLLGLVIFPWEEDIVWPIRGLNLADLAAKEGWPEWQIKRDVPKAPKRHVCVDTLDDLVYHIRNAASHRHIQFSSDSRDPAQVTLKLADGVPKQSASGKTFDLYWWGEINAALLREFVEKLANKIDEGLS